jgi:RNA polymerase sigma-70 factor, ECF subfamily
MSRGPMPKDSASAIGMSLPTTAFHRPTAPSTLEDEVVELFNGLGIRLSRYVQSFGIPVHDTEEIVQEVFLSLFQHLRMGRSRSNLRGWLFRVAHNLALKKYHSNERLKRFVELDEEIANRRIDVAPSPEERMETSERQERLRAVLHALPEQDQRCLYLRAEGFRYREIVKILGMSLGAISASIARSLARLGKE